jgi:hypothetical protein
MVKVAMDSTILKLIIMTGALMMVVIKKSRIRNLMLVYQLKVNIIPILRGLIP